MGLNQMNNGFEIVVSLKDKHKRKMNQMEVSITFLEILYATLEAKGNLEDLSYYFDRCFQKEHLYFFATLDKDAGKISYSHN